MSFIKVSAPGSLMLTGEHAVLHGSPAAACAVDKRIYLTLKPRTDREVHIESPLGNLDTTLDSLPAESQFKFIIEAIRQNKLNLGVDIKTSRELSQKEKSFSKSVTMWCMGYRKQEADATWPPPSTVESLQWRAEMTSISQESWTALPCRR